MNALYQEMRSRFEKLELEHFERVEPGKNNFVIKAFPERSAELKREWQQRLRELVGPDRAELLDHSIRIRPTFRHLLVKRDGNPRAIMEQRRKVTESGPSWLERGNEETRLDIRTEVDRLGRSSLRIDFKIGGEGGERGSGSFGREQVPRRWQHLLPPEMLKTPLVL